MRWTKWAGMGFGLLGLAGCGYGYQMLSVQARYSSDARPHSSYFCYDCHGYRYFDPYYDYCTYYGFRYGWAAHPQVVTIYRDRYVRIKENHPDYGRYRYRNDYRAAPRYREPRDYETWRGMKQRPPSDRPRGRSREREKDEGDSGKKERGDRKGHRDGTSRSLPGERS